MPKDEDYLGREQSQVKHFILQRYLSAFANIIGSVWNTINYVDSFSGPWESHTSDLSDTSFSIALSELRRARTTLRSRRKSLSIRCMFLEKDPVAYARLKQFADQQEDIEIKTLNEPFSDSIAEVLKFIRSGNDSFSFTLIDPTGWEGFDLQVIKPLLIQRSSEVLINFMTEHIRRFATSKEKRESILDSFVRLFGSAEVFERVRTIADPQDREDELFMSYAAQIRAVGKFDYTCPSVVLHPNKDRTYFHLIYATRNRKGVEKFKEVEKSAFIEQERIRAAVEERQSNQPSLFASLENQPPSARVVKLRKRYLSAAQQRLNEVRGGRSHVPFDEFWDAALGFPLVWDSDVKDWVKERVQRGELKVLNLGARQRVPQWGENHILEFIS